MNRTLFRRPRPTPVPAHLRRGTGRRSATRVTLAAIPLALAWTAGLLSAQQPLRPDFPLPVEVTTRTEAVQLSMGDHSVLVYELLVANLADAPLTLTDVVVVDGAGRPLAQWAGEELAGIVRRLPAGDDSSTTDGRGGGGAGDGAAEHDVVIRPGERHILYGWVESATGEDTPSGPDPTGIVNHLHFGVTGSGSPDQWTVTAPEVTVSPTRLVIDAPVRGGRWWVSNGYSNSSDHRRFLVASGRLVIPQRFGSDYLKLDADGNNALAETPLRNESFHAFGEPVYAVADGVIESVHAGVPDNEAGATPSGLSWEEIPGNHVVLKLGEDVYALYAHLRRGSIQVDPGQRVSRGELIGHIGNSGNTSAPHLHFHMMSGPHPNRSEGLPFHFRDFELILPGYSFAPDQRPLARAGTPVANSAPRSGWVVRFPGDSRR